MVTEEEERRRAENRARIDRDAKARAEREKADEERRRRECPSLPDRRLLSARAADAQNKRVNTQEWRAFGHWLPPRRRRKRRGS